MCNGERAVARSNEAFTVLPSRETSVPPEFEDDRYTILEVSIGKKSE
jgi:hypothetical protein